MPRRPLFVGDFVYHVINRAATRMRLFDGAEDYMAVQRLLFELKVAVGIRLRAYCIMPNHWHLINLAQEPAEMSRFLQSFTGTHAQRWRAAHSSTGSGAVYQGRYRAFPFQTGVYFLNACRYVERNPLRAKLVRRAEEWHWSSCWLRLHEESGGTLDRWPIECPDEWLAILNAGDNARDVQGIRHAVNRGIPYGEPQWVMETATTMGIESRLRPRGRPRKDRRPENPSRPLLSDGERIG